MHAHGTSKPTQFANNGRIVWLWEQVASQHGMVYMFSSQLLHDVAYATLQQVALQVEVKHQDLRHLGE